MKLIDKPVKFVHDVNQEMSKVSWPTYEELKSSTIVVILLSLACVVYIFGADWLLTQMLKLLF